jgi:riboflavin synthase
VFTGIVLGLGRVRQCAGGVLVLEPSVEQDWQIGESVAVNGVCLTVVEAGGGVVRFDLSPETLVRTALGDLSGGHKVNLERALRPSDRLGGHFVQGHVDAVGTVVSIREEGNSKVFTFEAPVEYDRYLVDKGSICVDGVSLTVVEPKGGVFDVWVVPHTLAVTSLQDARVGRRVSLEFDMLAKYLEKLMSRP